MGASRSILPTLSFFHCVLLIARNKHHVNDILLRFVKESYKEIIICNDNDIYTVLTDNSR